MPRFKSSADILNIVTNKDQIRNIGIIAHVDHGKCVSGDSLVTLSDGQIEEIANVYSKLKRIGPAPLQVDSLNPNTLMIEDRNVSRVWKLHSDKLVKVTLRNGYCVETTPEHPFYSLGRDGKVTQKRADRIGRCDFVLVPNILKSQRTGLKKIRSEILEELASRSYYIAYLDKKFSELLRETVRKNGIKDIHSRLRTSSSFSAFKGALENGRVRIDDLVG